MDSYYTERIEEKPDKKTGELKRYKDGTPKTRTIRPSHHRLKSIQKSIKNKILDPVSLPEYIHGGVKRRSNITNAKAHQGNKYQFTTDLHQFYPSITYKDVFGLFLSLGYSNHIAHWLTKLTTWKYELPQGTPTSTHIANLVVLVLDIDEKLTSLCKENGLIYTRFVDDLTFSSPKDFKHLLPSILGIINRSGYRINHRKTAYSGNQNITGIDVYNNYIDASKEIKQKVAAEALSNSQNKPYTNYLNNIRRTN